MRRLLTSMCLAAVASAASAQAPRLRVELGCEPADAPLIFLCTVDVTDAAGKPIDGASITLSADMPSMPMAHNVSPVKVQPVSGKPGSYQGRVTLEMLGEWAVRLRLDAPQRDVVVRKLDFQKDKVSPAPAR
jgi:hypothetical protein